VERSLVGVELTSKELRESEQFVVEYAIHNVEHKTDDFDSAGVGDGECQQLSRESQTNKIVAFFVVVAEKAIDGAPGNATPNQSGVQ